MVRKANLSGCAACQSDGGAHLGVGVYLQGLVPGAPACKRYWFTVEVSDLDLDGMHG